MNYNFLLFLIIILVIVECRRHRNNHHGKHNNRRNNSGPSCWSAMRSSNILTCERFELIENSTFSDLIIPSANLKHLHLVNVSGVIGSATLGQFPNLNSLEIVKSRLENVTFAALPHLNFLVFEGNFEIPAINSRFFAGIEHISWFSLISNRDLELASDCLENLSNLTWLHIQKQNFPRLDSQFLSSCVNLEELTISWSNLSEIESTAFDSNENLVILSLNFNNLKSLELGTFRNLSKLRYLELHQNHFVNLDLRQFSGLKSLEIVGFPSNVIRTVNGTNLMAEFPNLKKVEIMRRDRKRPEITELIKKLIENGVEILGTPVDCNFPHPPYYSCLHNELAVVPPLTTHT